MFRKQVKGTICVMTKPAKLVIQLSVVTMVFGNVSSVFRCASCSGLCLDNPVWRLGYIRRLVFHTTLAYPLWSNCHVSIPYKMCVSIICIISLIRQETRNDIIYETIMLTCTIVFATINNIKGNWQCIGTYVS
jgi:hypothetical protein